VRSGAARLGLGFFLVGVACGAPFGSAAGETVTQAGYVDRLDACASRLRALSGPAVESASLAAALRECETRLDDLTVASPEGTVKVANHWVATLRELAERDGASPSAVHRQALGRLEALRSEVSEPVLLEPRADSGAVLAEVLDRPEFGFRRRSAGENRFIMWLRRRLERLGEAVARVMESIMNRIRDLLRFLVPEEGAPIGANVGRVLLLVVGGALLVFLAYALGRYVVALHRRHAPSRIDVDEEIIELPKVAELLSRARELGDRGEWRGAIRFLYLALLASLEGRGLVRYDRSKTNWEYARELAPSCGLRERFLGLTDSFDRIWYGMRSASADDYRRFDTGLREISEEGGTG